MKLSELDLTISLDDMRYILNNSNPQSFVLLDHDWKVENRKYFELFS